MPIPREHGNILLVVVQADHMVITHFVRQERGQTSIAANVHEFNGIHAFLWFNDSRTLTGGGEGRKLFRAADDMVDAIIFEVELLVSPNFDYTLQIPQERRSFGLKS